MHTVQDGMLAGRVDLVTGSSRVSDVDEQEFDALMAVPPL